MGIWDNYQNACNNGKKLIAKLEEIKSKWKIYQSSHPHRERHRVYQTKAAVHVKSIKIIAIATVFSAQTTTRAHAARSIPQ